LTHDQSTNQLHLMAKELQQSFCIWWQNRHCQKLFYSWIPCKGASAYASVFHKNFSCVCHYLYHSL